MKFTLGIAKPTAAPVLGPFSATDKSALIALSSANSVATRAAGAARWVGARGRTSKAAGKWYFECTLVVLSTTGGGNDVGVMNSLAPVDNGGQNALGVTTDSVGYTRVGDVYYNGAPIATYAPYVAGDIVSVAFDPAIGVWFRLNGGAWNGGAGNPATGAGALTAIAGAVFAGVSIYDSPGQMMLNTGQAAFAYALPAGFAALG